MKLVQLSIVAAGVFLLSVVAQAGTLDDVKNRGELICGVDGGLPGFSAPDNNGRMQGVDADVCYAIAVAVLGPKDSKVRFVPLTAKERFTALASGEIDVLSRNTTHTLTRDSTLGINFTYYNYIDGAGFMVRHSLGVDSAKELDGAQVCVQQGTTTELNMADFFRSNGISFKPVGYETSVQTREGFDKGACDAITSDKSQLAAIRSELKDPSSAKILPETISKEPLGPVVRQGDDEWFNVVKWSLYAMINAEELGVTSSNARSMRSSDNPDVKRLLGTEGNAGKNLGLPADWAYNIVRYVGNFGESYDKHLTPLGLTREGSVNDLWTRGGIIYAPPIR